MKYLYNQFLKIQFKNFAPQLSERRLIFSVMREVEFSSPSDSSVELEVRRMRGGYQGVCRVASQVGIFTADCEAENLESLMKLVKEKIRDQLKPWNFNRFKVPNQSTGEFSPAS